MARRIDVVLEDIRATIDIVDWAVEGRT